MHSTFIRNRRANRKSTCQEHAACWLQPLSALPLPVFMNELDFECLILQSQMSKQGCQIAMPLALGQPSMAHDNPTAGKVSGQDVCVSVNLEESSCYPVCALQAHSLWPSMLAVGTSMPSREAGQNACGLQQAMLHANMFQISMLTSSMCLGLGLTSGADAVPLNTATVAPSARALSSSCSTPA